MDEASTAMDVEQRDAFAIMMANATVLCPPDDPWYVACLYKITLLHVDSSEPLFGITYQGQALGPGDFDPMDVVTKRWKQEVARAAREHKQVGLLAALEAFGADAFHFELVDFKRGRRSAVQKWADEGEVKAIAAHGGVLRSMTERCAQTLNLTKGGQGFARWEGLDAFRMVAFGTFKTAMEAYVAEFGTALVPQRYMTPSGYQLGQSLNSLPKRTDPYASGCRTRTKSRAWAEARMPGWAWNATETSEYRDSLRECAIRQWNDDNMRDKMCTGIKRAMNRPTFKEGASERMRAQRKRERFEDPKLAAQRSAKCSATCDARFEAKLEGKTEEEQRKMKREHKYNKRAGNGKTKSRLGAAAHRLARRPAQGPSRSETQRADPATGSRRDRRVRVHRLTPVASVRVHCV